MTTTLKQEQVATILKQAIAKNSQNNIAAIMGLPVSDIADVLCDHGYPSEQRMRKALAVLTAGPPAPTKPAPRPHPAHEPHKMSWTDLISAGKKSKSRTVLAAVKKAEKALDAWKTAAKALQDALTADREEQAVREQINKLEAELAAAKSKLNARPTRTSTTAPGASTLPDGVTPKMVRQWAAENDVDCPERGMVPKRVVSEYLAAHSTDARTEALHEAAWPTPKAGAER